MLRQYNLTFKDYAISFVISLLVTIILANQLDSDFVPPYSLPWFVLTIFFLLMVNYVISIIYKYLFVPPIPRPVVPQTLSAFDSAVREAGYNFCAISSKELALWRSPTFMYYLTLNDIKNILEFSLKHHSIMFSNSTTDKTAFIEEGYSLLKKVASGQVDTNFFGIRLLIYPDRVYKQFENEIKCLIQMHAIARVHCIPVIREKLIKKFSEDEKSKLSGFSKALSQNIQEELTSMSGVEKATLWLSRKNPNNPYSVSIPDFLIINNNPTVRSKEQVWWYQKNEPRNNNEDEEDSILKPAEDCYRLLCSKINSSVIWPTYGHEILSMVPIGIAYDEPLDFFSQDYFEKWLTDVLLKNPKYELLRKWIEKEQELLRRTVKAGNSFDEALDVGCGWGRHLEILLEEGISKVAGIDNNALVIQRAHRFYDKYNGRLDIRNCDAQKINFKDERFDLVICMSNTFGNLGDQAVKTKVMNEMLRVLKPGGKIIVSVYQNSEKSLTLRKDSYLDVGLHPIVQKDGRTIKTKEGLTSEQFDIDYLESFFKKKCEDLLTTKINECAFIVTAKKKVSRYN